jgi:rRNA processing protein Krr1/Pno1
VEEWDSQTAEVIDVPMDKHKALIGRGGDIKRQLEAQFKVSLDIPRQGEGKTGVKITGQKENVEKAKEHVQTLIKEKHGETVQVPRTMHHSVSNGGQFFRTLRNDYGVTVDHAGQSLPQRPQASRANGGQLPLITDDADAAADAHSWSTVQNSSGEEGDIPWVLRGSAENVEKAKKAIQAALEQGHKSDTTGYLVLPDPRMYRHIIGPSGSKVKSIRQQSGCRINVPRDQARDEAIEIIGTKEGVEKAKELILAAVREGANKARE